MLNYIMALVTGLGVEIGLKVLKSSKGPAIKRIIPICPMPPKPNFKNQGYYLPNGFF